MTCIVGYADKINKKIIMGGDSAGVSGYDVILRQDPKVFIKDNKFIIGFTTSFRMGQILHFMPLDIEEQDENDDDLSFMVKKFVPAIRTLFKDHWGDMKNSDGSLTGGCFLVGYKNSLYEIESDFQVGLSHSEYGSVGCGSRYALGALKSMETLPYSARERVQRSLEIAEHFSGGVRGPFIILEF